MKQNETMAFSADDKTFDLYANVFKALADPKRLKLMNVLCTQGKMCVCDLCDIMEMPQSKLSYHLKLLMDANLIKKEKRGKWNYYELNQVEVKRLLSPELCYLFYPACCE